MRIRLIIVALVAFALGAIADRCAKVSSYDRIIASQANRLELQEEMIREQKEQLAEINSILAESD
jgi:hypothetical protein